VVGTPAQVRARNTARPAVALTKRSSRWSGPNLKMASAGGQVTARARSPPAAARTIQRILPGCRNVGRSAARRLAVDGDPEGGCRELEMAI